MKQDDQVGRGAAERLDYLMLAPGDELGRHQLNEPGRVRPASYEVEVRALG